MKFGVLPGIASVGSCKPRVSDNAATAQVPQQVLDTIQEFHGHNRAIHRAVQLGRRATKPMMLFVARLPIGALERNIVFTRGTTEAINLVATAEDALRSSGDNIILSEMEHHNIVRGRWFAMQLA